RPAIFARNSSSRTLLRRSGRMMATTSFILPPGCPSPGLRPPSPRFAGRGALDVECPSPRLRGESAAKRRMRGVGSFAPAIEQQNRSFSPRIRLHAVLRDVEEAYSRGEGAILLLDGRSE